MNKNLWKALEYSRDGMFVPHQLTSEMLDKTSGKRIMVLYSFEMLPVLHDSGYKDVTLVTGETKKYVRNLVDKYGYKIATEEEAEDMKFDLVIGNPPYQSPNESGERNIGAPLWPVFIGKSMEWLNDNGTLAFITPATWMTRANGGAWKHMRKYDLTYVCPDASEHFPGVGSTFTWFTLEKRPYGGVTELSTGVKVDFHNDAIPTSNTKMNKEDFEDLNRLMTRTMDLEIHSGPIHPSITSTSWSPVKTDRHIYETYYSGKEDRQDIWCDEPVGHHGEFKLVVPSNGSIYKTARITRQGVGRQGNYILGTKKELKRILGLMNSDDSKRLNDIMREGGYNNALRYIVE